MAKIGLVLLGLVLVYWLLRHYRRGIDRTETRSPAVGSEDMVRCDYCGLHLPRSESITADGRHYCTAEHRGRTPGS